jgi:hypothetical protein
MGYLMTSAEVDERVEARLAEIRAGRPHIVTLCGSTRFKAEFEAANATETLAGRIVLSCGVFGHADGVQLTEEQKAALDGLHLQKIRQSDSILVINPGGYVGSSTEREIAYARSIGVPVRYLVEPEATS